MRKISSSGPSHICLEFFGASRVAYYLTIDLIQSSAIYESDLRDRLAVFTMTSVVKKENKTKS